MVTTDGVPRIQVKRFVIISDDGHQEARFTYAGIEFTATVAERTSDGCYLVRNVRARDPATSLRRSAGQQPRYLKLEGQPITDRIAPVGGGEA